MLRFPKAWLREHKKDIILFCISLLLVFLFSEIILKAFFPQKLYNECYDLYYTGVKDVAVNTHPYFGWVPKPNYTSCAYQTETNQVITITHNSQGMRLLDDISLESMGRKRIMLLGDSYVYGYELDDTETLAYQFQSGLGENYEVLPLAAGGYGTDQEYLILGGEGLTYEPDIVMVFFF